MFYSQDAFRVRCEWGREGVDVLAPISDVVVIVDVLSFSTCVDVAVGRGAVVWPCSVKNEAALQFAWRVGAELAGVREEGGYSLSPGSLQRIPAGTGLVLPSPNGAALTLAAAEHGKTVLAGSLRNAGAVARAAGQYGNTVALIPAGERWPEGTLRPALEDWLGAGAIIAALDKTRFPPDSLSPEAQGAAALFLAVRSRLRPYLLACGSGRELSERGFEEDVLLAAEHDASGCVPTGEFREGEGYRFRERE